MQSELKQEIPARVVRTFREKFDQAPPTVRWIVGIAAVTGAVFLLPTLLRSKTGRGILKAGAGQALLGFAR